jgi:hypothetical protein
MTFLEWLKAALDVTDGHQRFLMTIGAGFVNTALLVGGYIDMGTYFGLTGGTVVAFIGAVSWDKKNANVAQA